MPDLAEKIDEFLDATMAYLAPSADVSLLRTCVQEAFDPNNWPNNGTERNQLTVRLWSACYDRRTALHRETENETVFVDEVITALRNGVLALELFLVLLPREGRFLENYDQVRLEYARTVQLYRTVLESTFPPHPVLGIKGSGTPKPWWKHLTE